MEMRKKFPVPFERKFPNADPSALRLLQRLLAFDPKERPTAQEVSIYISRSLYRMYLLFFNINREETVLRLVVRH